MSKLEHMVGARSSATHTKLRALVLLLSALTGWSFAAPLTIYDQPNLGGTGVAVSGIYTVYSGQSGIPGGLNNNISSFQLEQGYMVIVADQSDGMHPSKTYIASDAPLTVNTLPPELDNAISFIRIVPWKNPVKKGKAGWTTSPPVAGGWYYKWNAILEWGQETNSPYGEYAPMCFGAGGTFADDIANYLAMDQVTHLLGFNEPDDCNGQSGQWYGLCQVTNAVGYFQELQKAGLRLGSPSGTEATANNSTTWTSQFIQLCDAAGIRVDVACLHWYDWGGSPTTTPNANPDLVLRRFKQYLSHAYHMYRRPIWITEFNANLNRVTSVQDAFLQNAMEWLDAVGYVERYAYYQPNSGTGNFFDTNGVITSTGLIYSNHVSTPSYGPTDLPTDLTQTDVGSPTQTGIALHREGTFTVGGNGSGVGGTSDQFCFLYKPAYGDCEIVARLFGMVYRQASAQAGIMIRESLSAGSKQASMILTSGQGSKFINRTTDDGASTTVAGSSISTPCWIKLNRTGNLLSAYTSSNGVSWTLEGSQTIAMNADVYVGMIAATPDSTWESDGVYTDLTITSSTPNQSPVFTSNPFTRPNATENTAYSETIAGSATDADNDILSYTRFMGPTWLNVASDGTLSGTPPIGSAGPISWAIQVSDGNGGSDLATLNITVNAAITNQPPKWNYPPTVYNATQGVYWNNYNAWRASDPENDPITWAIVSGPPWVAIVSHTGELRGTPGAGDVGTNPITISITDSYHAPVAVTASMVVAPAVSPTMHVSSIVPSVASAGGPNYYGVATVTILDGNNQPVSGATVSGTFTGSYNETGSAVTDGSGVAVIQTVNKKKNPSFTFTVDNVTAAGYSYNPAANVETSDSY